MHSQKCRLAFTGRAHMYVSSACPSNLRSYSIFVLPLSTTPETPSEIYSVSGRLETIDVM